MWAAKVEQTLHGNPRRGGGSWPSPGMWTCTAAHQHGSWHLLQRLRPGRPAPFLPALQRWPGAAGCCLGRPLLRSAWRPCTAVCALAAGCPPEDAGQPSCGAPAPMCAGWSAAGAGSQDLAVRIQAAAVTCAADRMERQGTCQAPATPSCLDHKQAADIMSAPRGSDAGCIDESAPAMLAT